MKFALIIFVLLYFYLVMPRMFGRADRTPFLKQKFYAHRGLFDNESEAPENSLKAFEKAVQAGYGIELDVQMTKDGKLVVFHDATLQRMCGLPGKVWEYTLEELKVFSLKQSGEKIPAFSEVLELVDGKVPLIVEYKLHQPSTKVCVLGEQLLKDYEGDYCIESFHPLALLWYRKHCPKVLRGQLSGGMAAHGNSLGQKLSYVLVDFLLSNVLTRPDFIAYDERHAFHCSRKLCQWMGALSVAYTIRREKRYQKLKKQFDLFIFDSCRL